VTLQNCIVGNGSVIQDDSVLKEVIVNHKGTVQSKTNLTKETVY
jgi:carbonic anhydrase/acetyltransferase-like protein (isoleucine patch superfamily)